MKARISGLAVPSHELEQSLEQQLASGQSDSVLDDKKVPAGETEPLLTFTKHPTYSVGELFGLKREPKRVGVPGYETFNYASVWSTLSMKGTCFQAIFKSSMFYIHCVFFAVVTVVHWEFDSPELRGASVPPWVSSSIQTVTVFCVVFFTTRVYSRFNERFHDVCKTNGAVTVVSSLSTGYLAGTPRTRAAAVSLCRYAVAILHVYYYLIAGPMDAGKWGRLTAAGVLTEGEAARLASTGSPGVVLYTWCARLLQQAVADGDLTDQQALRVEQAVSTVRGLAAKQIACAWSCWFVVFLSFAFHWEVGWLVGG